MKYTPNYGLKKPEQDDFYNVEDFNENANIIDEKLKEIEDEIENIDAPVTSVNEKTGDVVLTADDVGAETPTGAQAKASTAEANAKNYADETKVSKAGDTITGILTMDGGNAINFGGKFQIAYNSATNSLDITVVS